MSDPVEVLDQRTAAMVATGLTQALCSTRPRAGFRDGMRNQDVLETFVGFYERLQKPNFGRKE